MIKILITCILITTFLTNNCLVTEIERTQAQKHIGWTVDFSTDGKFYATGGTDKLLKIFNSADQSLIKTYVMKATIQSLYWDKTSKMLAIGLDDQSAELLNVVSGVFTKIAGTSGSRAVAWNSTGELLAVGDYDNSLYIVNRRGSIIRAIKKTDNKTYLTIDWHPSKNLILTGSDRLRLYDTTGKLLKTIKHRQEETAILTVRWHPSGTFFAVGDYGEPDNNIPTVLQFWKEDGTLIKTMSGSKAEYRNVRWNKSGSVLATASDALRLWSPGGKLIHESNPTELLWGLDWNNNDSTIITSNNRNQIMLWDNTARLVSN